MQPDHSDEIQDTSLIEQKLAPTFELLGRMLKELDDRIAKTEEATNRMMAFLDSLEGVVKTQRRGSLLDEIKGKFGADLDPIDSFYNDTYGKNYSDELVDSLMDDSGNISDQDAYIRAQLDDKKKRYGKYFGVTVAAAPEGEPAAEGGPPVVEEKDCSGRDGAPMAKAEGADKIKPKYAEGTDTVEDKYPRKGKPSVERTIEALGLPMKNR